MTLQERIFQDASVNTDLSDLHEWPRHPVQESLGEAGGVHAAGVVHHLLAAVQVALEAAAEHLHICLLLLWCGHSALNHTDISKKISFKIGKLYSPSLPSVLDPSAGHSSVMATHLVEGFDSELILVRAVLILCLGAAHAGRVAEVFGLVVPRVAQVHYHLHSAPVLLYVKGFIQIPAWCRCRAC